MAAHKRHDRGPAGGQPLTDDSGEWPADGSASPKGTRHSRALENTRGASLLDRIGYSEDVSPQNAREAAAADSTPPRAPSVPAGYYSRREETIERVAIPRAPRLPTLSDAPRPRLSSSPPPGDSGSWSHVSWRRRADDDGELEAREEATDGMSVRDTIPAGDTIRTRETIPAVSARAAFSGFPAALREQASEWLRTGTLHLAEVSSPRRARAVQRALLLSLLLDEGWSGLPDGLQRRAAWLFRPGWAGGDRAEARNDLCFVLGLPLGEASGRRLNELAQEEIPDYAFPPASSSEPPRRD